MDPQNLNPLITQAPSLLHQAHMSLSPRGPVYHRGPIRVESEVTDLLSGLISSRVT